VESFSEDEIPDSLKSIPIQKPGSRSLLKWEKRLY
jgi:hypothetical protein